MICPPVTLTRRTKLSYRQLAKLFLLREFAFIPLRTATGLCKRPMILPPPATSSSAIKVRRVLGNSGI